MTHPALGTGSTLGRFAALQSGWALLAMLLLAAGLALGSMLLPGPWPAALPLAAGGTLMSLTGLLALLRHRHRAHLAEAAAGAATLIEEDPVPAFTSDTDGMLLTLNRAARERFPERRQDTLAAILREDIANPAALVARLMTRAEARGAAWEEVVTRRGHVRLAVHQIGEDHLLWRVDDIADRGIASSGTVDGISLAMMTVSKGGAVLFMNEAARRLLGGRAKSLDRVISDLPLRNDGVHVVRGAEGPVRCRVVGLDGAAGRREVFLIPLVGHDALRDDRPEPCRDDPAEGTCAERAQDGRAPVSEEGGAGMLEALPVAVVKITPTGSLKMANRLARALLSDRAQPGARLSDLLEGLGRPVTAWLGEAAEGRGLGRAETMRATHSDQETFVQVTLQRMREAGDTVLVAVLSDATELKTLEAQFVQSQKMQAIGQLAGGVAHDFNNLLTAISGHCDLLLLRHAPDDPDYADLVQINQNANRAASLVGQLLAFSRKQNLQLAPVDLRDALGELTHLLNRLVGEKVRLTLAHDPRLKPIRADKRQLEQVIMNLVVNARDAMPDGGEIRIETEVRRFDDPYRRDRAEVPPGDYVLVRVTDCGVGIPAENLPKVFEPFFSTKGVGEGTGLGLSTAYGIVKQTGGYIFADSVAGQGTTFTLFFPVHEQVLRTPARSAAGAARMPAEPAQGVVLLVEDEAPVRAFASRALRMRGYTVIEAENAEEALRALEDEALKVDVFVTDVIMPGMDGPSWVRKALKDRPDAKVVFVSGYAEESFTDAQAEIPNSVFLPKPFSLNELAATVHDQIH